MDSQNEQPPSLPPLDYSPCLLTPAMLLIDSSSLRTGSYIKLTCQSKQNKLLDLRMGAQTAACPTLIDEESESVVFRGCLGDRLKDFVVVFYNGVTQFDVA